MTYSESLTGYSMTEASTRIVTFYPDSGPSELRKFSVRFSLTNRGASREAIEVQRATDRVHFAPGGGRDERRGGVPVTGPH